MNRAEKRKKFKEINVLNKDKIDSLSKEEFEVWMRYHLSTCEREELQVYSNHMLYICKKN